MHKQYEKWAGFDLDGTLARNDHPEAARPPYPIGEPIEEMLALLNGYLRSGWIVKIFTARACEPQGVREVKEWCVKHGLGDLDVTNQKDFGLAHFFDDRAIPVEPNKGVKRGDLANVRGGVSI